MKRPSKGTLAASAAALVLIAMFGVVSTRTDTTRPRPTPAIVPAITQRPSQTPRATATVRPSKTPTGTSTTRPTWTPIPPTVTATVVPSFPTGTPTDTPVPTSVENLLDNGMFLDGDFSSWKDINGYWEGALHDPVSCNSTDTWFLQMDTFDPFGFIGWPAPVSSDTAWTNFSVPEGVTMLNISWDEAHHLRDGYFAVTVQEEASFRRAFYEEGVHSPDGTGKCNVAPPLRVSFDFPVPPGMQEMTLTVSGTIYTEGSAYLMGNVVIVPVK